MNCPNCQATMTAYPGRSNVIGVCPQCRGMWFGKGELQPYLNHVVETHSEIPHARAELYRKAVDALGVNERRRTCVRCGQAMVKLNYGYDSNIILDRCQWCEGVWVDAEKVMPLAVFTKGNPKIDRLATSLAEHKQEELKRREFEQSVVGFTQGSGFAPFMPKIILPLFDDQGRRTFPFMTLALIAANAFVYLLFLLQGTEPESIFAAYGMVASDVLAGNNLWTLVTHMFIHGGFLHVFGNMFFLWIFGDNVEDSLGHVRFALSYLIGGLCAALLFAVLSPNSAEPCVGASGAVSGVMGAFIVFYPRAYIHTFVFNTIVKVPALVYLGCWFGFQLLYGIIALGLGPGSNVAWFAHVGGFAGGVFLALVWRRAPVPETGTAK